MTHLIKSIEPSVPIIMQIDDCDWPELLPYVGRLSDKYGWEINFTEPDFSVLEVMRKINRETEDFCSQSHPLTREAFLEPLRKIAEKLGVEGSFIGLRSRESKARKINLITRGAVYRKKNGQWMSTPMYDWNARDVFAYLSLNNVEINPCYFKNRFEPPENIRLAWFVPTRIDARLGGEEQLKYYNPDLWKKLNG